MYEIITEHNYSEKDVSTEQLVKLLDNWERGFCENKFLIHGATTQKEREKKFKILNILNEKSGNKLQIYKFDVCMSKQKESGMHFSQSDDEDEFDSIQPSYSVSFLNPLEKHKNNYKIIETINSHIFTRIKNEKYFFFNDKYSMLDQFWLDCLTNFREEKIEVDENFDDSSEFEGYTLRMLEKKGYFILFFPSCFYFDFYLFNKPPLDVLRSHLNTLFQPWSPNIHFLYPKFVHTILLTFLLCLKSKQKQNRLKNFFYKIPSPILFKIIREMGFLNHRIYKFFENNSAENLNFLLDPEYRLLSDDLVLYFLQKLKHSDSFKFGSNIFVKIITHSLTSPQQNVKHFFQIILFF